MDEALLNDGSKRGIRGKVTGIELIYATLLDEDDRSTVRIPNNLLFQRTIRTIGGEETRSLGSGLFDTAGDGRPREVPGAGAATRDEA